MQQQHYKQDTKIDDRATRPERHFEARKAVWIVVIVIAMLACGGVVMSSCLNPTKGVDKIMAAGVTPVVDVPAVKVPTSAPVVIPTRGVGLPCHVLSDIVVNGVSIPALSKVTVTGFTYAAGQKVFVSDSNIGWVESGLVQCDGDLVGLEKSYVVTSTPVPSVTPTINRVRSVPVVNSSAPLPTYTPYPTYTPPATVAPVDGVVVDSSGCYTFNLQSVNQIWVNGSTPVAGGSRVCDIKTIRVIVK